MRVFKHEGSGHYIGSCVLVLATTRVGARNLIRRELDDNGLKDEALNITDMGDSIEGPRLIYSNNGDY